MNRNLWSGLSALLLSTLACQPMIVVGWNEFLLIFLLLAVLTGPPLYRFIRRLESRSGPKDKEKPDNQK